MSVISMRPATESDSEFAFQVKKAAFRKYIEQVWGWDEIDQRAKHDRLFLEQEFRILNFDSTEVGVMALVKSADQIRVDQLFLLPEYQRMGIGRECMRTIMDEARTMGLPVKIQVLKVNQPAQAFSERLGFERTGETETHIQLEWLADATPLHFKLRP